MRIRRKYVSNRNIFIFAFTLAAIALSSKVALELPAVKTLPEVVTSEMTRPIGVAISILAMTVVGLICLQLRLQARHSRHEKECDKRLRTSDRNAWALGNPIEIPGDGFRSIF